MKTAVRTLTAENVQLHVRMELEHERRIRTQLALDEAERNYCSARRDLDNRAKDLEELNASSDLVKGKFEKKVKILGDENRRLRACIKDKENQIRESEARAKSLSLKVIFFFLSFFLSFNVNHIFEKLCWHIFVHMLEYVPKQITRWNNNRRDKQPFKTFQNYLNLMRTCR